MNGIKSAGGGEISCLFERAAGVRLRRYFYYTTLLALLSSKICKKIAQIFIPKFVQNYYLFFIKNNDIINYKIKEGKTVGAENNSKNLKKKVLTNKNSYAIINT